MVGLANAASLVPSLMLAAVLGITPTFAADPSRGEYEADLTDFV
jgi:hypothetical protein